MSPAFMSDVLYWLRFPCIGVRERVTLCLRDSLIHVREGHLREFISHAFQWQIREFSWNTWMVKDVNVGEPI